MPDYAKADLKDKIFKIVTPDEVEALTEAGWQILESFDQDDIADIPIEGSDDPTPPRRPTEVYPPRRYETTISQPSMPIRSSVRIGYRPVAVRRRYYTLMFDRRKVVEDLSEQLREVNNALGSERIQHKRNMAEQAKTVEELKAQVASLQKGIDAAKKKATAASEETRTLRGLRTKLEGHLRKVRKAIGEIEFEKIIEKGKDK